LKTFFVPLAQFFLALCANWRKCPCTKIVPIGANVHAQKNADTKPFALSNRVNGESAKNSLDKLENFKVDFKWEFACNKRLQQKNCCQKKIKLES
uniref:Uncharacterized protein n=1 Tax=Romanomermis culicivorax TaxID=13658 RepID=A0A915KNU0_ROMCU